MEDGIDRNCYFYNEIKKDNEIKNKKPEENFLYVCKDCLGELQITFDKNKATKFVKEKTHKIEIYKKNEENVYVPNYNCFHT